MLSNNELKHFARLNQKKYRRLYREFLVEGVRLCEELLNSSFLVKHFFISPTFAKNIREQNLLERALELNIPVTTVSKQTLERLCTTKTPAPIIGCCQEAPSGLPKDFFDAGRFVVLDSVSDPGNIGTILRSARAFGWNRVILLGQKVEIYNPKIVRSSMGAIFHIPVYCSTWQEILSLFQDTDVSYIVTLPNGGVAPDAITYPAKLALLLGSEAHGISSEIVERAYARISLPMNNDVESLNVSIAGGILLYLLR